MQPAQLISSERIHSLRDALHSPREDVMVQMGMSRKASSNS